MESNDHCLLNVGGNNKTIGIPSCFDGWRHDLLDIDQRSNPDVICDARELWRLPPRSYDAIYCCHNLEHFYRHDLRKVLRGFNIVLKKDGFAYVRVPDVQSVMKTVVENGLDIDDVLYESPMGPILVSDVLFGYHVEIERSGQDYYSHKNGFSLKSLAAALKTNGFPYVFAKSDVINHEITALAFLQKPSASYSLLLGLL
jgi:hypothetical protein